MVNEYNNAYSTIRLNPTDVKSMTYIDFSIENNAKDSECEFGNHVGISK